MIGGALDRPVSLDGVLELAHLLGHGSASHRLDGDQPGSFLACHAEKQFLVFMLWNHTTALEDIYGEAQLNGREPTRLSRLRAKTFFTSLLRRKPMYVISVTHSVPRLRIVSA